FISSELYVRPEPGAIPLRRFLTTYSGLVRMELKDLSEGKMQTGNLTRIIAEPGKQEVIISREFDAPRESVFKAYTDPDLYVQWVGPRELTTKIDKFEPWSGGSWRWVQTNKNGNTFAFHGVNHEVKYPERLIGTWEFEGLPESGHVELQTARFEALPGNRTRVVTQSVYQSVADRDGEMQAGTERGINESYARLDELLAKRRM